MVLVVLLPYIGVSPQSNQVSIAVYMPVDSSCPVSDAESIVTEPAGNVRTETIGVGTGVGAGVGGGWGAGAALVLNDALAPREIVPPTNEDTATMRKW